MKLFYLCALLFLAGAVSSSAVNVDRESIKAWGVEAKLDIPDWILDLISLLPESIQEIIDRLPEIIAQIPGILEQIPAILEQIPAIIAAIINWIPEIIPIIIDKIPEIIAQVPAAIDLVKGILQAIIDKLPEVIPIILEKIPEVLALIPEIYERIREVLESLDLPDWFPTLPDLEKPDWWPEEFPEINLPEINRPVPGNPVSISQYPGIVQVEVGTGLIWVQGCAGSVLTNFHILSAARCFSGLLYNDRFRRVRAGSSSRYEGGTTVSVNNVINHPEFGLNRYDADIAIVRLQANLILGGNIQQAPIVPQGFFIPAGLVATVVGWGATAQGGLIIDRQLHEKDLVAVDQGSCSQSWANIPLVTVSPRSLCLGQAETGGRNGDLRDVGALVYFQGSVVGIVSVGAPVGNQKIPVITTNVGDYTSWILANAV